MSTPMYDLPEHIQFPLNADGQGPADGDDFDHWGCWCSDPGCRVFDTEVTGKEHWSPIEDMVTLKEALTTGGQTMSFDVAASGFSGIHVPHGETWYFERTLKFRIEGRPEPESKHGPDERKRLSTLLDDIGLKGGAPQW